MWTCVHTCTMLGSMNTQLGSAWARYICRISGTDKRNVIAKEAGVSPSAVSRWLTGRTQPTDAGNVAALALAYGRSPVEAFVAAGLLDVNDASRGLSEEELSLLADVGVGVSEGIQDAADPYVDTMASSMPEFDRVARIDLNWNQGDIEFDAVGFNESGVPVLIVELKWPGADLEKAVAQATRRAYRAGLGHVDVKAFHVTPEGEILDPIDPIEPINEFLAQAAADPEQWLALSHRKGQRARAVSDRAQDAAGEEDQSRD